jgi:predicted adenylyl cyclase CyaB
MLEVEKKVRLSDSARAVVDRYVRERSDGWGDEAVEVDRYFRAAGFRARVQTRDDYLVRVRTSGERATLNLKKLTDRPGVISEHETSVGSAEAVEAILLLLGAEFACTITKRRRSASVDGAELLLDDIDELGSYLEVSREVEEFGQSPFALERIDAILHELGAGEVELRGYPDILLEQQGVIFDRTR